MASRLFSQFRNSLEKEIVDLYLEVTFGAAGAPTLNAANSKGIVSITGGSGAGTTGTYVITLKDRYNRLLGMDATWQNGGAVASSPFVQIGVDYTGAAAKTLTVTCYDLGTPAAPAATDPGNGDTLKLHLALSNSTAK